MSTPEKINSDPSDIIGIMNIRDILDLSLRISQYSPAMKPFIRFSKQADHLYEQIQRSSIHEFWDFDYTLQKILLDLLKVITTPEDLDQQCINQWRINLKPLCENSKDQLDELYRIKKQPDYQLDQRDHLIMSVLKKGGRFLYIGCGSGKNCLKIASHGYDVIGIDTNLQLTEVAHQYSTYGNLPFQAICMNASNLGFAAESFDGFLIEFYGYQPSFLQTMSLQRELVRILKRDGRGIIVANRKKYASYWYYMGRYPSKRMTDWIVSFSKFDFFYSISDNCEERLQYGFYNKSHTTSSLSGELDSSFEVLECMNEEHDPRYVIGIVKPKKELPGGSTLPVPMYSRRENTLDNQGNIPLIIEKIRTVCEILQAHETKLHSFFLDPEYSQSNPLTSIDTEIQVLFNLLRDIYILHRNLDFPFNELH